MPATGAFGRSVSTTKPTGTDATSKRDTSDTRSACEPFRLPTDTPRPPAWPPMDFDVWCRRNTIGNSLMVSKKSPLGQSPAASLYNCNHTAAILRASTKSLRFIQNYRSKWFARFATASSGYVPQHAHVKQRYCTSSAVSACMHRSQLRTPAMSVRPDRPIGSMTRPVPCDDFAQAVYDTCHQRVIPTLCHHTDQWFCSAFT